MRYIQIQAPSGKTVSAFTTTPTTTPRDIAKRVLSAAKRLGMSPLALNVQVSRA
jgi:hypothetical protein